VEPWPQQRERLRELAGTDQIPVMQTEDGRFLRGTREIFAHLRERDPWRFAAAHRRRFADHREARDSDATGKLLEYFRDAGELEPRTASPGEATVVNVPEAHRFELLLDGQRIGELAYRQRKGRIAFTHTNVNPAYEGRGFGGRLAEAALADARRQGLTVVPLCPFIAWYIEQHPEHGNLVAADYAGRRDES
jgi:predicted GNAT family acetyltransferase